MSLMLPEFKKSTGHKWQVNLEGMMDGMHYL